MVKINLNLIKKNPLSLTSILADKQGIFKKYNIDMNLYLDEDFFFKGNVEFLEGRSDAMMGDTTFFFYMLEKGKKAVITSNLTRTINLVGGEDLPKDLNGIRVGVNRSGLFRLFLENDLKDIIKNPKIVWINNTYDRIQALESGEIDALVAIEPFVSKVVNNGGSIIWDSRNSDKNLVMWCFDEDFYNNNKEAVKNFHKALNEAAELINNSSSEEKVNYFMEYCGFPKEVAESFKNFNFEINGDYRKEDFNLCQEWMHREGEIKRLYDATSLVKDLK
ncbi:ABC transporter substrate-binding protein [Clostridium sartagoforme]|uniref:ABC transporter substrate-binding protein n=1 Tax=Clostridium sartagoforme TaxID=84031 RepID=A0A4V3RKW3_9CLOT|nr:MULTISPECIES: ABC transporter substrate-binding protein [Clostridium]MBS5938038.1 ABC transporter substrate-binding protein [Clostridium sp.]TGY41490.1 ABC transporter substrate-binding protein [Clostridium sartagoforme]